MEISSFCSAVGLLKTDDKYHNTGKTETSYNGILQNFTNAILWGEGLLSSGTEDDWVKFEAFFSKISNRYNIYYCTNKGAISNYTN